MSEEQKKELERIQSTLISGDCTEKQWRELHAAQQAILWTNDPSSAKSPFSTVMRGLVISPQEWEKPFMENTQATKEGCPCV